MTEKKRTWINALIGITAVILVIYFSPSPLYQARGIILPAQETRPAISPDSVVVLSNSPLNGKIMGHISIERHYSEPNHRSNDDILQLAKQLSSQVGANGFVITLFRIGQVTTNNYIYVFQATAYYVPGTL